MAGPLSTVNDCGLSALQLPACQTDAQTQVDIFAIHKIGLVKTLNGLPCRQGQYDAGCIDPIYAALWLVQDTAAI